MSSLDSTPMCASDAGSSASSTSSPDIKDATIQMVEVNLTTDLEDLQTDEQRRVLDTIAEVRKCGLESVLSLPQLVVCGDQSAGKSSVLEALTGVPFPRNDNLCTRFATEISLRRAASNSLTIKVIPDDSRSAVEQTAISAFSESISDFDDLPRVMKLAMKMMGIDNDSKTGTDSRAFARDVLSIDIEGPSRPQLTLVDIPGLIATSTRGVTKEDVTMVAEITDHYISQPRTICLAVVSAVNDYANQKILTKVRDVDPDGNRTLGIITKPDGLAANSGAEKAYLDLAQNKDIFFKLGWHVLKNRKFEERQFSLVERNAAETTFFTTSNFKTLSKESVGIDSLRRRLSVLLFEHVKNELPKLRQDLEQALSDYQHQFDLLGKSRSSIAECKSYLSQLSLEYWDVCKAAINGNYEHPYFLSDIDPAFQLESPSTIRRIRALVQALNMKFARNMEISGHKFKINMDEDAVEPSFTFSVATSIPAATTLPGNGGASTALQPEAMSRAKALVWVKQVLHRNRGKELIGNFNPLLIGELFWEQSSNWRTLANDHVEMIDDVCRRSLKLLLEDKCPPDVKTRIWSSHIEDALNHRLKGAYAELELILEELRSHPINYNHYYTETIAKRRQGRLKRDIEGCLKGALTSVAPVQNGFGQPSLATEKINIDAAVASFTSKHEANMDNFSCSEALDCLLAIYKVTQKVFVTNITTQVIERHIVKGLETIFSPVVVNNMSDSAVEAVATEPLIVRREREFLSDRIAKLKAGHNIFKKAMSGSGR